MKKIFALLIAVISFSASFAQSRKIDEARRIINGETNTVDDRRVHRDRDYRDDDYKVNKRKYAKKNSNPGKHLGWQKGKGNPHRTGAWKGKNKKG